MKESRSSEYVIYALVAAGCAIRLVHYFANRCLWIDECFFAMNVKARGFAELATPLSLNQTAPLLFLWAQKLATVCFGAGEMALRLVPLLAGMASVVLVA